MKAFKYLFVALLPLGFAACDDDDDDDKDLKTVHTQTQQKAQALFQGEWVATPVLNEFTINGTSVTTETVHADTLSFGVSYASPKVFYRNDYVKGETYNFTAYGECTYKPQYQTNVVDCYYYISPTADAFELYDKETERLHKSYSITFDGERRITLKDGIYTYVFNRE